jgi:pilus assembly protein Flp/PilA
VTRFLTRFARHEGGATAIEYGLILAGIFLAIVGAAQLAGANVGEKWNGSAEAISAAVS